MQFMRSMLLVALTMFAATSAMAQGRPPQLQRTTLVVSDVEKSIDFYQRIGFTKASDTQTTDKDEGGVFGATTFPLTADSKGSRLVVLRGGDAGALGLLWYDRPQLPSARGNLAGMGTGDVIVVIEVPDIQVAYTRLSQIGTRFHLPPTRFTTAPGDGGARSGMHLVAYDPDGHIVEVAQTDMGRR